VLQEFIALRERVQEFHLPVKKWSADHLLEFAKTSGTVLLFRTELCSYGAGILRCNRAFLLLLFPTELVLTNREDISD
jgi:hypothetical protein